MKKWSYWIKTGLFHSSYVIAASAFYSIFISLTSGELTLKNILSVALGYFMTLSSVILCIFNINKTVFLTNVVISMGETRRNCHTGLNVMNITTLITNITVAGILTLFANNNAYGLFTPFILLPSIQIMAIGCGMCICCIKREMSATTTVLQTVLLIAAVALLIVIHYTTGAYLNGIFKPDIKFSLGIAILCLLFGLLFFTVGNILMKKKIRQLEVSL